VRVVWLVLLVWAGGTACTPFIPVKDDFGTSATAPAGDVPPGFAEFNAYNPGIRCSLTRCAQRPTSRSKKIT